MAQLYSWTNFSRSDVHPSKQIKIGDEVSRSDFEDLSDDEYEELLAIGAIREQEYPIPKGENGEFVHQGSPREYALDQLAKMEEEGPFYADRQASWKVPQLQARAQAAKDASDFDPGDIAGTGENEEAAEEQDSAEKKQGTRTAMKGLTPGSAVRRTDDKPRK